MLCFIHTSKYLVTEKQEERERRRECVRGRENKRERDVIGSHSEIAH